MDLRALFGTDQPPCPARALACGPAAVSLEEAQLRHLHVGGVEAIRGVMFLVRDRDWGTVLPQISDMQVISDSQGARVTCRAVYDMGAGRLTVGIALTLTADSLTAEATGWAEGEVLTNRAGFTVLHPIEGVAGAPVTLRHSDGQEEQARFPALIAPWQPFQDIAALTHRAGDWMIGCAFQGDVFEMEDQRQWGDASFKTYNRPLALPWPYRLPEGQALHQSVRIRWWPAQGAASPVPPLRATRTDARFPQTALAITAPEALRAAARPQDLTAIGPQRLLCHLDATAGGLEQDLTAFAALQAGFPGLAFDLELIAACPPDADLTAEFAAYARAIAAAGLRAASVMVTPAVDRQSVPPGSDWPAGPALSNILAAARAAFPGLPLGAGVASFFPELNRKRPPAGMADYITHGLCPIVHAADDISVFETLEAVPHILASGRAIAQGAEYRLGPSTLGMRQNPYGSRTIPNPDRRRICMAAADPRQDGEFAAAWTCGLAAALAPAGLTVWTPAALYGPRGLLADDGTPRPVAGLVTALAARAGYAVHDTSRQGGLAMLRLGPDRIVANLTPDPVTGPDGCPLPGFGWRAGPAG